MIWDNNFFPSQHIEDMYAGVSLECLIDTLGVLECICFLDRNLVPVLSSNHPKPPLI